MTAQLGRKNRSEAVFSELTEPRTDVCRKARQIRSRAIDRRLPFLPHEGRLVGMSKLEGLNVARTGAPYAQRAALAGESAIRRVVIDSVQPAHDAAVARMSHDHRSLANPLYRRRGSEQLQFNTPPLALPVA